MGKHPLISVPWLFSQDKPKMFHYINCFI